MQNSSETNQFIDAMAELQFYMEESEEYKKEKENANTKKKKDAPKASRFESKDPIPRAETVKETKDDEEEKDNDSNAPQDKTEKDSDDQIELPNDTYEYNADNDEDEEVIVYEDEQDEAPKEKFFVPAVTHFKRRTPAKYMGMPRYKEYDPAAPTVGVEAVKEAVRAMKELQMLQRNHYPYLLICMRDDGTRTQTKFRTLIQAQEEMDQEIEAYIDQVEPIDINKEIYIDDGLGPHTYKPTPENEINPDGSFRHKSEIDGTLHVLKEETKGIVYFETQNSTARWDIFNIDIAEIGDKPDDPEFEEFVRRAIEEAAMRDAKKEDQEEKKKEKKDRKIKRKVS